MWGKRNWYSSMDMYKYNKISTDRIEYQMTIYRNIKIVLIGMDNQISMIHPQQKEKWCCASTTFVTNCSIKLILLFPAFYNHVYIKMINDAFQVYASSDINNCKRHIYKKIYIGCVQWINVLIYHSISQNFELNLDKSVFILPQLKYCKEIPV